MEIHILRLGHRRDRDKRITTHIALVGRAFGARGIYVTGDKDPTIFKSVEKVNDVWGGDFFVEYIENWKQFIRSWEGIKVHLTMYGVPLPERIAEIKSNRKILVIVGSEKVPGLLYSISDFNISIGSQPHSEVGALAVFLDRMLEGEVFRIKFKDARKEIIPSEKGKRVVEK